MDYRTLHNKYKAITRYDDYSVDVILGVEMSTGGLGGAVRYVDAMVDFMRMHALAEALEGMGHDPMDALDELYDAYSTGGAIRMEAIAKEIEHG